MDDLLTEETIVVFLPEFDVELREFNLKMAKGIERDGGKLLYVKLKQMAHKVSSRLIGVEVGREMETSLASCSWGSGFAYCRYSQLGQASDQRTLKRITHW